MIKEHIIMNNERGETQEHIDICQRCPFPMSKCNGECNYFKAKAKELRKKKKLKKNIIVF